MTGTVVEDTTGLGVPGVEVYARAVAGHEGQAKNDLLQAEGATNDQGQFVFSNMAEQQYQLVLLLNSLSDWTPVVVTGGQDEPGVIRIRIPTNSESMPQKP